MRQYSEGKIHVGLERAAYIEQIRSDDVTRVVNVAGSVNGPSNKKAIIDGIDYIQVASIFDAIFQQNDKIKREGQKKRLLTAEAAFDLYAEKSVAYEKKLAQWQSFL